MDSLRQGKSLLGLHGVTFFFLLPLWTQLQISILQMQNYLQNRKRFSNLYFLQTREGGEESLVPKPYHACIDEEEEVEKERLLIKKGRR